MIRPEDIPHEAVIAGCKRLALANGWKEEKAIAFCDPVVREIVAFALMAWKPSWTETDHDNAGDIVSRHYVLDITPDEVSDD